MKIRLHIDRLVLEGIPVDGLRQDVLDEQVRSELAQLIREHGLEPAMKRAGAHASMPGGDLTIAQAPRAPHLGRDIARSVFDAIGPKEKTIRQRPQSERARNQQPRKRDGR